MTKTHKYRYFFLPVIRCPKPKPTSNTQAQCHIVMSENICYWVFCFNTTPTNLKQNRLCINTECNDRPQIIHRIDFHMGIPYRCGSFCTNKLTWTNYAECQIWFTPKQPSDFFILALANLLFTIKFRTPNEKKRFENLKKFTRLVIKA